MSACVVAALMKVPPPAVPSAGKKAMPALSRWSRARMSRLGSPDLKGRGRQELTR